MNNSAKKYLVVLSVLAVITVAKADVDCSERPPFVDPKDCCDIQNLITDEVKEKCEEYMKPPPPREDMTEDNEDTRPPGPPHINRRGHHHHNGPPNHCFFSCFLNETGIMVDGEFQMDNLNSYLNDALDDADIIDILSTSFQECSEKMNEIFAGKRGPPHGRGGGDGRGRQGPPHHRCPPHGGMIMHCALIKTFKQCPESIWADTEECNDSRDFWNECKPSRPAEEEI